MGLACWLDLLFVNAGQDVANCITNRVVTCRARGGLNDIVASVGLQY